jgi:hypothetical protein
VPYEAADVGCGGMEAGQNVGGDDDRGWILLEVSLRKLEIVQ